MKKIISVIPLLIVVLTGVKAQSITPSTINATGGHTNLGGTEFEWSVGEMAMVSTFSASGIIVTQGLLQPAEAMVGVPTTSLTAKNLHVFPNPASDVVNLQYTSATNGILSCRLYDMTGKEISNQKIGVVN